MSLNKINHVFLFFLFLSFFGCKSESLNTNLKSNWEYLNLKGKVKTLKQIEYSGESKSSMIFQSTYFVFNKQGFNTSLEIGTNKESTLVETIYKNEKFVTKEVRQLPNKGGTSTTTFKYNERNQIVEEIQNVESGNLYYTTRKTKEYDKNGNLRTCHYDHNDNLSYCSETDFENGEEVELRTFENDIVDWRIRKNYSKGKLSKRLEYEKSRLVKINVYEYDEYGSEVKNSLHDKKSGEKKITTSEYKYDKNGNWLERRRYESGNLISLITQEIELYNL